VVRVRTAYIYVPFPLGAICVWIQGLLVRAIAGAGSWAYMPFVGTASSFKVIDVVPSTFGLNGRYYYGAFR
jgi:hypothetical protein